MSRRVFVFDLDGTIVSKDGIHPETAAALRKLYEENLVCFASGRMHVSMSGILRKSGLDGPMISYNGALTSVDGRFVAKKCLDPSSAGSVVDFLRNAGVHRQLYLDDKLYVEEKNDKVISYSEKAGVNFTVVKDLKEIAEKGCVFKLLAYGSSPEQLEDLKNAAEIPEMSEVSVFSSSDVYLEFVSKRVNKFEAVRELGKIAGFSMKDVVAFGDGENDAELLENADLGIAMKPGHPLALEKAGMVAENADGKGVVRALEKLGMIKS